MICNLRKTSYNSLGYTHVIIDGGWVEFCLLGGREGGWFGHTDISEGEGNAKERVCKFQIFKCYGTYLCCFIITIGC